MIGDMGMSLECSFTKYFSEDEHFRMSLHLTSKRFLLGYPPVADGFIRMKIMMKEKWTNESGGHWLNSAVIPQLGYYIFVYFEINY